MYVELTQTFMKMKKFCRDDPNYMRRVSGYVPRYVNLVKRNHPDIDYTKSIELNIAKYQMQFLQTIRYNLITYCSCEELISTVERIYNNNMGRYTNYMNNYLCKRVCDNQSSSSSSLEFE